MTPFPETEIMTLKRLEVALKKGDYKLLKDGTYKLHEKYHSGFRFEYIDLLKDILYNVNNSNTPSDIKDILIPTIEDILSENEQTNTNTTSPYESLNRNRVSALTSLNYKNSAAEEIQEKENQEKISAFDVFKADKTSSAYTKPEHNPNQNIKSGENLKFILPKVDPTLVDEAVDESANESTEESINESLTENTIPQQIQQTVSTPIQQVEQENTVANKTKIISVFYAQNNSDDKNKNITKYNQLLLRLQNEKVDFSEIMKLISEINTQSNSNVAELASILEQIQNRDIKINLITNSTNSNLAGLIESIKIPYKFNSNEEKINVLPLFGLTNMFKCTQCKEEYIDLKDNINPYVLQCPKCKSPMLPNFSCINTKINLDFYNNAIINLANSDIWLILYPNAAEKAMLDIMKSALLLNKKEKNIFICDKDINAKENYKTTFIQANKDIKVNIEINALEDFLKSV